LPKNRMGGPFIVLRLHEDVQHIAFAVDSSPQPTLLTIHQKDDFVQVPLVRHFKSIRRIALAYCNPNFATQARMVS
jgi:hypothetical protein